MRGGVAHVCCQQVGTTDDALLHKVTLQMLSILRYVPFAVTAQRWAAGEKRWLPALHILLQHLVVDRLEMQAWSHVAYGYQANMRM